MWSNSLRPGRHCDRDILSLSLRCWAHRAYAFSSSPRTAGGRSKVHAVTSIWRLPVPLPDGPQELSVNTAAMGRFGLVPPVLLGQMEAGPFCHRLAILSLNHPHLHPAVLRPALERAVGPARTAKRSVSLTGLSFSGANLAADLSLPVQLADPTRRDRPAPCFDGGSFCLLSATGLVLLAVVLPIRGLEDRERPHAPPRKLCCAAVMLLLAGLVSYVLIRFLLSAATRSARNFFQKTVCCNICGTFFFLYCIKALEAGREQ